MKSILKAEFILISFNVKHQNKKKYINETLFRLLFRIYIKFPPALMHAIK